MKNNIQKLIIELKKKEEKALQDVDLFSTDGDTPHLHGIAVGKAKAFSSCIQWLILILNTENEEDR